MSSFNQYLLRLYYAPNAILMEDRAVNEADKNFPFMELTLVFAVQSGERKRLMSTFYNLLNNHKHLEEK